jgi:hypothetical protein
MFAHRETDVHGLQSSRVSDHDVALHGELAETYTRRNLKFAGGSTRE